VPASMNDQFDSSPPSLMLIVAVLTPASLIGGLILSNTDAIFGTLLAAAALWVAAVDLERFEIPDLANIAIFVLGVVWSLHSFGIDREVISETTIRSLLAAGLLFAVRELYRKLRRMEGLGLGDVKLAGAGASWLSWPHIVFALLIAAVAGIMLVLVRAMLTRGRIQAGTAIPFGAFLAPAIWVAWVVQAGGFYP
jgi:leader peptidase (prepilin peptidase) / N-methyltransferase